MKEVFFPQKANYIEKKEKERSKNQLPKNTEGPERRQAIRGAKMKKMKGGEKITEEHLSKNK